MVDNLEKAFKEGYDSGFKDGAAHMEKAKQIIIDNLLSQIKQHIEVGDVIRTEHGTAEHLVLRIEENCGNRILHVCNIANGTVQTMKCNVIKTEKHFDVENMLASLDCPF